MDELNQITEPNVSLESLEQRQQPNTIVIQMPADDYDQNNLVEVLEAVEALALPLLQKTRRLDKTSVLSDNLAEAMRYINSAVNCLLDVDD